MKDKLKEGIRLAVVELDELAARQATLSGPPVPGDEYVLPDAASEEITLSWLVVREHPDSNDTVLIVPLDTFHLVGVCDFKDGVKVARCGASKWAVASELKPEYRVDHSQPLEVMAWNCRRILAALARGKQPEVTDDQKTVENDPNYEHHMREVLAIADKEF